MDATRMKPHRRRALCTINYERPVENKGRYIPFIYFRPPDEWTEHSIVIVYEELQPDVTNKEIITLQKKINKNKLPLCPLFQQDKIVCLHFIRPAFAQVTLVRALHRVSPWSTPLIYHLFSHDVLTHCHRSPYMLTTDAPLFTYFQGISGNNETFVDT